MANFPLRVAVATKDGTSISEHFGHARAFRIYELSPQVCQWLENRSVDHYCHGQTGSASAMEGILATLQDCHAVFVARVGDGPVVKLAAMGTEAVTDYAYEAIEDSLLDYASRQI